jgi:hypothetical protein
MMRGVDPLDELRKMSTDPETPAHLRLGALKELGRLERSEARQPQPAADRDDGLPTDPLLADFPDRPDPDSGRVLPADPMADLDWQQVTGRMPHRLYAKVLVRVPEAATKRLLLDAEARFLRECRNLGLDTEADEVAERRWRRQQKRRNGR